MLITVRAKGLIVIDSACDCLIACFNLVFLVHQTVSTTMGSKSRQSKVEELGGILDKMRVQSKTTESNLGKTSLVLKCQGMYPSLPLVLRTSESSKYKKASCMRLMIPCRRYVKATAISSFFFVSHTIHEGMRDNAKSDIHVTIHCHAFPELSVVLDY